MYAEVVVRGKKITITIPLEFKGKGATEAVKKKFIEGIEDFWTGKFGDYEVETSPEGVLARDIGVWQPDPDGTGQSAEVKYTYRVLRPLTAYFQKTHNDQKFSIFNCVTPVDGRESASWMIMALNYASETSDEQLRIFQDVVSGQDVPIVESQRPELLPLDLQAELHLRSDRTAIAYRKWLSKIGLKYGIA